LSDREGAELAWKVHLSINNSIIVDLFQVKQLSIILLIYIAFNNAVIAKK